jgi:hypothetical protein
MTSWFIRLVSRIRGLFGQEGANSEFDLETETHLQLLTERFVRQGMDPKDAWSAARRQFGNATLLRQRHRESRTLLFFPNVFQDLRYGLRMLSKSPAFSMIAAPDVGSGDWSYVRGFQFDSGRAAYPTAVPRTATADADSKRANGRTEDGQPARLGSAAMDGMERKGGIVSGHRGI